MQVLEKRSVMRRVGTVLLVLGVLSSVDAFIAVGGARLPIRSARHTCGMRTQSRMQSQQNDWLSAVDEKSGAEYWYDPSTGQTSWDDPGGGAVGAAAGAAAADTMKLDARGNVNPLGLPYLPNGGRMGQLLGPRTDADKKNMMKGTIHPIHVLSIGIRAFTLQRKTHDLEVCVSVAGRVCVRGRERVCVGEKDHCERLAVFGCVCACEMVCVCMCVRDLCVWNTRSKCTTRVRNTHVA